MKDQHSFVGIPFSVLSRTPTIQQLVRWGHVQPSPESSQEELRISLMPATAERRSVAVCTMCGKTRTVNASGQCSICWEPLFGWVPPNDQDEPRIASRRLVTAAAAQDVAARWEQLLPARAVGNRLLPAPPTLAHRAVAPMATASVRVQPNSSRTSLPWRLVALPGVSAGAPDASS